MNRRFVIALCALGLVGLILVLCGCRSVPAPVKLAPTVDTAPTMLAQEGKDRAVVDWAAKIEAGLDTLQAGRADLATVIADIRAAVAAQRAAVVAAPASQFNVIVDAYKEREKIKDATIAAQAKQIADFRDAERKKQILWLRIAAAACIAATVALAYFGLRAFAGLTGFGAILCLGLAQLISQPWFETVFNWSLAVIVAAFVGVGLYEFRRQLRLKADALRQHTAADDVISGLEEVRALFKEPTAEMAEIVRNATTPEQAIEAVRKLGKFANEKLAGWVTEADGTAAIIDARRRALKLIS